MANVITGIRIVCALSLIFCPAFSVRFYFFYTVGGISDVLDGIAARRFGKETGFGAQFDTAADAVFFAVVIVKVILPIPLPTWILAWIGCVTVIKCINVFSGLIQYKRLVSEHTVMNRICGVLVFVLPLCIGRFSRQEAEALIVLNCAAATFAAIQEGHYIRTGKEIK